MTSTTTGQRIGPADLGRFLSFDAYPVRVHADGTVTTDVTDAPWLDVTDDGETVTAPWVLLSGWTRQDGYRGPVMHPSETVGGQLARHILDSPGLWAVAVAEASCDDECGDGCDGDHEPCGWVLAHVPDDEDHDDA